ncbi:conserved protein, unknown function, partial [Hepatocystis sp. ex Piliocolobus tephrosceles]
MEDIYEQLKIIDYSLICFLNKYRIIYKYVNNVLDLFIKIIYEYNSLIQKLTNAYKQNVYDSIHNNIVKLKNLEEQQKEQEKNITEIKEKLKKAVKHTKTSINFNDSEDESN